MAYVDVEGAIIERSEMLIPRAKAVADLLASDAATYATLVYCRRVAATRDEIVVFDVDVQRGQRPKINVGYRERIAAQFFADEGRQPEVLALRDDFPWAPHQNVRDVEIPRSICLYAETWDEIRAKWTPIRFVERIRWWMRLTAAGELHQDDQPLEPFLFGSGISIVLPADLFAQGPNSQPEQLVVVLAGEYTLRAWRPNDPLKAQGDRKYLAISMSCQPQTHGVIRRNPHTLKELHELVETAGLDFLGTLRKQLRAIDSESFLGLSLIVVISMPKQRQPGGASETTDTWAFCSTCTLLDIGREVGCWTIDGGKRAITLGDDTAKQGNTVGITVLRPYFALSRERAAILSGLEEPDTRKVVGVGVGALGSQVVMNLVRVGYGQWTLVDEDILLPHNTARHDLGAAFVGCAKATAIATRIQRLLNDTEAASAMIIDMVRPGDAKPKLDKALGEASVILDMAVSIPVSRHLVHDIDSSARRISLFVNPRGTDLVLLAEDAARSIPLDVLEMQYYRALATRPELGGHLVEPAGRVRHGRSCRDVTFTIAQDLVAEHAAIGARVVRQASGKADARICVWRIDPVDSTVKRVDVPVTKVRTFRTGCWTMKVDEGLLGRMNALRRAKLPKETGGVLMGSFDLERQIVYLVDTIPSPPDSEEWPTFYVRGSKKLADRLNQASVATAGNMSYVGEWHSHPDVCTCHPSADDLKVFGWLTELMGRDGLPAMMAIVGDRGQSAWFIGTMNDADPLLPDVR